MNSYYLAPDVAVLHGQDCTVLYQGKTGRSYRVSTLMGNQLSTGVVLQGSFISEPISRQLLVTGILQRKAVRSINDWTPFGMRATLLLIGLACLGTLAWGWLIHSTILSAVWPTLVGWFWLPLAFCVTAALHEWGHALALRSMNGRSGRILLRRGWPWALVEVGPLQHVLPTGNCLLLMSGGILLELVLLSVSLTGLSWLPNDPLLAALVWASTTHLAFNLFPTPWSDSGQMVGLIVDRLVAAKGRGEHARSSQLHPKV